MDNKDKDKDINSNPVVQILSDLLTAGFAKLPSVVKNIGVLIILIAFIGLSILYIFGCSWSAFLVVMSAIILMAIFIYWIGHLFQQRNVRKAQTYKGMQKQLDEVKTLLQKFIGPDLKRKERISIVTEILHKFQNSIKEPEQQKEFERKLKILDDLMAEREERIIPNFGEWKQAGKWLENNQTKLVREAIDSYLENNTSLTQNQTPEFAESICAHLQLIQKELDSGGANLRDLNFSQVTPRIPSERDAYREVFISIRKKIKTGHGELSNPGQLGVIGLFFDILVEEYD